MRSYNLKALSLEKFYLKMVLKSQKVYKNVIDDGICDDV